MIKLIICYNLIVELSKRNTIYQKLKAKNYEDILRHFPTKYDENIQTDLSKPLIDGEQVFIFGKFDKMVSILHGNILRFNIYSSFTKGACKGIIYNQRFYQTILSPNKEYYFLGTYKAKNKAVMVLYVYSKDNPLVNTPIRPNYRLPVGVSQTNFYKVLLEDLVTYKFDLKYNIPSKYVEHYQLGSLYDAYYNVHRPYSQADINKGLRVFKYIEALKYATYNLYQNQNRFYLKKKTFNKINKLEINAFIRKLPYLLTKDQMIAINEIVNDMDSSKIMNRLLEGDVGTGKTIVAFLAIYANYLRKGQAVLLAPTQTLANQHYENALSTFKNTNLKICLLDGSTSKSSSLKNSIKNGEFDLIVGTHAVFADSINYSNLSLVIIDEQHKFGIKQREEIISKGQDVDTLMMSATPIPQTITKIMVSDLNVSILKEFPFKQRQVKTLVVNSLSDEITKAIKYCLANKKQVYVVAPKIDSTINSSKISSKVIYSEMVSKFGEENVYLMTGKTKKDEQEEIYNNFKQGKKLILVSTSLIEVGVDVKSASLLIVYEANYFGLASLHQLRGRIGRNGQNALAILVYDGDDLKAKEKLEFLANTNDGEKIALYDLEHRGGGDLLSFRQAGVSILQVANFVNDKKFFEVAKNDANEILNNKDNYENKKFIEELLKEVKEREEK